MSGCRARRPWCGCRLVLGLAWLSSGCGQVEAGDGASGGAMSGEAGAFGGMSLGGFASSGSAGASVGAGGSVVAGSAGVSAAGSSGVGGAVAEPPADVSGRWALFVFEDPVGVQLGQSGEQLGGRGCAGGTPPLEAGGGSFCGPVMGKVSGRSARFWFSFESFTYAASTLISADGRRMTGSLHAVSDYDMPTAWLRVPDGDAGLYWDSSARGDVLAGMYTLSLDRAGAGATEYDAAKNYRLRYVAGEGIASDLGSFWHSEIHRADSSLQVGPVPATSPELAVSMVLETSADSVSRVRATTASGHDYEFTAARGVP